MGTFIPNTKEEQLKMLNEIGYADFDDLFKDIPAEARVQGELNLPKGKSEIEVSQIMEELASDNVVFDSIFRGAGAYNHYVPAAVDAIANKEEFLTAYTPYQAEISQGILQSIFEYQTMMCQLTDMDIANASMYDGASAAAEACAMTQDRKHSTIYVSDTVDKRILSVIKTYAFGKDSVVKTIPAAAGATDLAALKETLEADDKAFAMKIQDTVRAVVDEVRFTRVVNMMREAKEARINTTDVPGIVKLVSKDFHITDEESSGVLQRLIEGNDLTLYGLSNAVTRHSQDVPDYDRATALEGIGYNILSMPARQWSRINQLAA